MAHQQTRRQGRVFGHCAPCCLPRRGLNVRKNSFLDSTSLSPGTWDTLGEWVIFTLALTQKQSLNKKGKLRTLDFNPMLPLVRYSAIYNTERDYRLVPEIAQIAKAVCNYDTLLLIS